MPLTRMLDATENIPDTTSTLWVSKAAKDFWCPQLYRRLAQSGEK